MAQVLMPLSVSQSAIIRVVPPECILIDSDTIKCILCWVLTAPRTLLWFLSLSLTWTQLSWNLMRRPTAKVRASQGPWYIGQGHLGLVPAALMDIRKSPQVVLEPRV